MEGEGRGGSRKKGGVGGLRYVWIGIDFTWHP